MTHRVRKRPSRAVQKPAVALCAYAPGHFTELIRAHNFPPCFEPQYQRTREVEQSEIARLNREARQAQGEIGTIVGLTRRADELISQRMLAVMKRRP